MKEFFITDIKEGDKGINYFLLKQKELFPFKNKPGSYLAVVLADKTGEITGKVWDNGEEIYEKLETGKIVKVLAYAKKYSNKLDLTIDKIKNVPEDDFDPSLFYRCANINKEEYIKHLENTIADIKDTDYRQLLQKIFSDSQTRANFEKSAAAKHWHGAYVYGLLEHTVNLLKASTSVLELYGHIINKDLVIAGLILHDIGKIYELSSETGDYTVKGRLLSHTFIGASLIEKTALSIENFPQSKLEKLLHVILSHHNEREFGALILPQTLEAILVGCLDKLEAEMTGFIDIYKSQADGEKDFSSFIKIKERFLHLK